MSVKFSFDNFFPHPNSWNRIKRALQAIDLDKLTETDCRHIVLQVRDWAYYDAPFSVRSMNHAFSAIEAAVHNDEPSNAEVGAHKEHYAICTTCNFYCACDHGHCPNCNKPHIFDKSSPSCGKCLNCCHCKTCDFNGCKKHSPDLEICHLCECCEDHCICINCGHAECNTKAGCENCGGCNNHCFCHQNKVYNSLHEANTEESKKDFNCSRLVGVEWEINCLSPSTEMYQWFHAWHGKRVHDGSCGYEIITPPIAGDNISKCLTSLGEAFKESKARVNSSCSVHVHVDARDLEWSDIKRLIKIYSRIEAVLYFLGGPNRIVNRYCKPCGNKYKTIIDSKRKNTINTKIINYAIYSGTEDGERYIRHDGGKKAPGRYKGLNLCPWLIGKHYKKNDTTVEFRIHQNTLDSKEVVNWTKLCAKLIDYVKSSSDEEIDLLMKRTDSVIIGKIAPEVVKWLKAKIRARKKLLTSKIEYNRGKFKLAA